MLKDLAKCIGEYKRDSILTSVYVTLEVIMEVLIPFLMALIIDYGITGGNLASINQIGLALVAATTIALFFGVMSGRHAAIASAGFAKNLRRQLFYNIQGFSFANMDKFSTPSLITRLTTDVTNIQNAYQMVIRVLVRSPAMLTFSLIMAFSINAKLSLVFLAAVPFLALGLFLIISRAYPLFERVFKIYDRLNNVVQENLRGIRVVKSYVREDHEIEKFSVVSTDIFKTFSKAERIVALNSPLMQFSMYGCTLAISWIGAQMIVSSAMTTGQLMSLIIYATQILVSLMMMSMVMVMLTISRASAKRIAEVLREESDLQSPENPVQELRDSSIRFQDVVFRYSDQGEKSCLSQINLEINAGETVGIIGGTGSGKTTLVQLIPRLYDVSKGKISIGGVDVRDYDLEVLREQVSMVLQKNLLFSGTIKENLRWGNAQASEEECIRVCQIAQADEFIRAFTDGYDTYIEQDGTNVSGGQRQRLCIARALLKKPKILILDDSTSAVDTKTDALIRQAFQEEIPNTTKIIIAQRISSVEHADKIIVLENGQIDAVGTHAELLEYNQIYQEVYRSQMKGAPNHGAA